MADEREGDWLARIIWERQSGRLELGTDRKWRVVGGTGQDLSRLQRALYQAQEISADYAYHPADGQPGALLAHRVASVVKGEVQIPPAAPAPAGTIY